MARTAREKGLSNIETAEAPAEHLPFEDETFDFVASRFPRITGATSTPGLGKRAAH